MPCIFSGQDAGFQSGLAWPEPRFQADADVVLDRLTGLSWPGNASLAEFPLSWKDALQYVTELNTANTFGFSDWRLPNRRKLRSLISHQTRRPALPENHPFSNVFANWYWSSTTTAAHPDHAWYVNLDGGRMFYGGKDQAYMLWPVRGSGDGILPRTGQQHCNDESGQILECGKTGQDGEYCHGLQWPEPRFEQDTLGVVDRLTGLLWRSIADIASGPVTWGEALNAITRLNEGYSPHLWRLALIISPSKTQRATGVRGKNARQSNKLREAHRGDSSGGRSYDQGLALTQHQRTGIVG